MDARTHEYEHLSEKSTILPPRPRFATDDGFGEKLKGWMTWFQASRPMRALQHWTQSNGTLLAGGMAYAALFSFFAAIWVLFSVAGLVLANRPDLTDQLIGYLGETVPGLIGENGVIKADTLKNMSASLTIAGIIALLSTLWTAMNFLNGARLSVRAVFDLPPQSEIGFAKTKLRDLGLLLGLGLLMLISAVITAASSGLITWILQDIVKLDLGPITAVLLRVVTILIGIAFDAVVVAAVLRILCQIRIPAPQLWQGAFIGAALIQVLKQLGSLLLGGASSNPLLATFAALLGVLIFFNFMCMVLLMTASWVKVSMDDNQVAPRLLTAAEAEELTLQAERDARRKRLATDRIRLLDELDQAPRWRRGKLRRRYEAVVLEQQRLEHEDLAARMGLDPTTEHLADAAKTSMKRSDSSELQIDHEEPSIADQAHRRLPQTAPMDAGRDGSTPRPRPATPHPREDHDRPARPERRETRPDRRRDGRRGGAGDYDRPTR